jgi:hypothetical protein
MAASRLYHLRRVAWLVVVGAGLEPSQLTTVATFRLGIAA